jgi:hypothetical protein
MVHDASTGDDSFHRRRVLPLLAVVVLSALLCPNTTTAFSVSRQNSNHHSISSSSTTRLFRQPSKWDLILDDDDDDDDDANASVVDSEAGPRQYTSCPPDMMYEPRIVKRAYDTFNAIRQAGGKETTNDVYVRDPVDRQVMWYTGKVARVSDVSLEDCIHRLYPMIERHACHLRPKELYQYRGDEGGMEVWTARGDSELEVAYNLPSLKMERFVHSKEWQYKNKQESSKYPSHIKASMVGFQGEVYQEGEDGFRTWRHDDGMPARPELDPGGESRPPTEEELIQYQLDLQQKEGLLSDLQDELGTLQEVPQSSSSKDESGDSDIIDAVITDDVGSNAESRDSS